MAAKLLICISASSATIARWNGKRVGDCQILGNDDDGLKVFKDLLTTLSGIPVYFMVDTVEEDYRYETLPHTFGADRAEMVSRKLKQHYRNAPFVAAWLQGRETGKRRDDRYLLSALTNTEMLTPWVEAVAARGLPVAGVYLLPMVSTALLEKLDTKANNLLLVAQHGSGLRLTFFRDRQFRLSRLTRGDTGQAAQRAKFITSEISNTRLYLHALRTLTLDEQVTVVLLDRSDQLESAVGEIARDNPSLACVRVGKHELSDRLGLPESLLDLSSDTIYLQLLGARVPPSNLAPQTVTKDFRRYQAQRAVYAAAGIVVLAAAGWCGFETWRSYDLNADTAAAAKQTALLQSQYRDITRQFPASPTSADNLKRAVEIADQLRKTLRTPGPTMRIVSAALEDSPAILIREFAWKYDITEIEAGGSSGRAGEPGSPRESAEPSTGARRKQSALVAGEIRPFRGDYRGAIDMINAFADRIAKDPAVAQVRVVKLPLNVNPQLTLSGSTVEAGVQSGSTDFRLVIVLKPTA